jgi:hypothetical protein
MHDVVLNREETAAELQILESIVADLTDDDWRCRLDTVNKLTAFVETCPSAIKLKSLQIYEAATSRLPDMNRRVVLAALQCLEAVFVAASEETLLKVLPTLLPALALNSTSGSSTVRECTQTTLRAAVARVTNKPRLLQALTQIVSWGDARVRACMMSHLADVVAMADPVRVRRSRDFMAAVRNHVLPLSLATLDEMKRDVIDANARLLRALHALLGDDVTKGLPALTAQKLRSVLAGV